MLHGRWRGAGWATSAYLTTGAWLSTSITQSSTRRRHRCAFDHHRRRLCCSWKCDSLRPINRSSYCGAPATSALASQNPSCASVWLSLWCAHIPWFLLDVTHEQRETRCAWLVASLYLIMHFSFLFFDYWTCPLHYKSISKRLSISFPNARNRRWERLSKVRMRYRKLLESEKI